MKTQLNKVTPYLSAVILFILIALAFANPVLQNRVLKPSDIRMWEAGAKEILDYREETGKEALWTNGMFSGMPAYQISLKYPGNLVSAVHKIINLYLPRPANILLVSMLGFYILLLAFRVNPWLAMAGAIAYAFSTYFIILLYAGHFTKAQALGYMPGIIAGIYLAFRRKYLLGGVITGLFLGMQLIVNHFQVTYYTLVIILLLGIFELVDVIKTREWVPFLKSIGILVVAVLLALGSRASNILCTLEYAPYSIRGKSELTANQENQTSGLDRDYAYAWSYGIDETLTLIVPNIKGGSSHGELNESSATYEFFRGIQGDQYARRVVKGLPLYWGNQTFTHGPVYVGAVILFLFVFAIVVLKGKIKWWLVTATVLSILLSWGGNFRLLSDLFMDYFPMYNKFRVPSMMLIIAEFSIPLLGILAIQQLLVEGIPKKEFMKGLKVALGSLGGLTLLLVLFAGAFSYTGPSDEGYIAQGATEFVDALREDRFMLLRKDAFRSLVFILLSALLLYGFHIKKIKLNQFILALVALVLIDLWPVTKRYLNKDDFEPKRQAEVAFQPTQADQMILQDPDPHFRVYDLTSDPFRSARASYFHKSIGGYHGAKLRRYQELFEYQMSKNNMSVINMLNAKYLIVNTNENQPAARLNPETLGNAWYVSRIKIVADADEEINSLDALDPLHEAVVDQRFGYLLEDFDMDFDITGNITLTEYKPNYLSYSSQARSPQLAIFSEIYYEKGWKAFIDGEPVPHFRVNYVLRAMTIPAGNHTIEFRFEPKRYFTGNKIAFAASLILILTAVGVFGRELILLRKSEEDPS